jgi:hypothetical protein
MGLIAIAGFLLSASIFFFIVPRLVRTLLNVVAPRWAKRLYIPSLLFSILLVWCAFNAKKLSEQVVMTVVSRDCGWQEFKTVSQVPGIFLDGDRTGGLHPLRDGRFFDNWYMATESALLYGYSLRVRGPSMNDERRYEILERTLRYGIRSTYERVALNVVRSTDFLMDFDKDEILAKNIGYTYIPREQLPDMWDILLIFLFPYQPSGECGADDLEVNRNRYTHVLPPKSELSEDEVAALVGSKAKYTYGMGIWPLPRAEVTVDGGR